MVKRAIVVLAAAAAVVLVAGSLRAGEQTANFAVQNSTEIALHVRLDAAERLLALSRERSAGTVELPPGKTALFVVPAGTYRLELPGSTETSSVGASPKAPTVIVLTRVTAGGREAIEASIAAAKDSEVVEPTGDERAALKKALREAVAKPGVKPEDAPKDKPPTAQELLPLVSFWADHDKRESERREDEKARREEALDELELLLWYSYWTAPYDPEHPELVARRAYWPRRVGGLVVYGPGAAPFIERYRPAVIVRPDEWRWRDGRVYLRVPAASGEAWLRWSF